MPYDTFAATALGGFTIGSIVRRPAMVMPKLMSKLMSQTNADSFNMLPILSLLETRVLGVLIEKQQTVPDSYPLTLNALVAGCNQKTSRDPVIEATDDEVQAADDHLKTLSLATESSGGRVMRYAHNGERGLRLPSQAIALLATLMLRGPQTVGELRINADRLHKFADISAVEGFLLELTETKQRNDDLGATGIGAMVVELPRQPGARENRWAHLLSGAPPTEATTVSAAHDGNEMVTVSEIATLKMQVSQLQNEVAALQTTVAMLCQELGLKNSSNIT